MIFRTVLLAGVCLVLAGGNVYAEAVNSNIWLCVSDQAVGFRHNPSGWEIQDFKPGTYILHHMTEEQKKLTSINHSPSDDWIFETLDHHEISTCHNYSTTADDDVSRMVCNPIFFSLVYFGFKGRFTTSSMSGYNLEYIEGQPPAVDIEIGRCNLVSWN